MAQPVRQCTVARTAVPQGAPPPGLAPWVFVGRDAGVVRSVVHGVPLSLVQCGPAKTARHPEQLYTPWGYSGFR